MKRWLIKFSFFVFCFYNAQKKDSLDTEVNKEPIIFNSDSIIKQEAAGVISTQDSVVVDLKQISVYGLPKFNNEVDRNQYNWLKSKVYRLYPYLVLAVGQYNDLQDSLKQSNNSSEFKKYVKKRQKQLSEEYEIKLKGLTKTEGKIFSKLMYRFTGKTVYEIIKEFRSGWFAFWWNAKAGAFDIDLKEPFDPYNIRDDSFVESILLRAYQLGELKPIEKKAPL